MWFTIIFITHIVVLIYGYYFLEQYFTPGVKIRYNDFVIFYYLDTSKWDLLDMKYSGKKFRFGLLGYMRFVLFVFIRWIRGHKGRVDKKRTEYNKRLLVFLLEVQKDLDACIEDAQHNEYLK